MGPGTIDRWISFELGRLNAGLVVEKKSLARLRSETHPACRTREGDEHPFERGILDRYASVLTAPECEALRLPITLVVMSDLEDSAVLSDELASETIRRVEKFGAAYAFRDGRMILPHALALDIVRRHGGAVQIAFA